MNHLALIDGPYGSSHLDFVAFDSVVLFSGSTGITFTMPILLDLSERVQKFRLPVKRITFVWIVKNTSWSSWISDELTLTSQALRSAGVEIDVRIHVTCDEAFTAGVQQAESKEGGCECDKSASPCCCIEVSEEVDRSNEKSPVIEERVTQPSSRPSSSLASGKKSKLLDCATFYSGRPDCYNLLWEVLEEAEGETGVGVCGPLGLNADVRKSVVRCSDERAVHKGTGAQGIYLHAECFGW